MNAERGDRPEIRHEVEHAREHSPENGVRHAERIHRQAGGDTQAHVDQCDGAEVATHFLADGFGQAQGFGAGFIARERCAHARQQRWPAEQEEQREGNDREPSREMIWRWRYAVLSPATGVTMAGLPLTTVPPCVRRPARSANVVDALEHFAQRPQARIDLAHGLRRACQPFGGGRPYGVDRGAGGCEHHQHDDRDRESAAHAPALQPIYRGCEQQREEQRHATGMKTSWAKYSTAPDRQHREQDDRFAKRGIGRGVGVLTAATLGYPPRHQQAQRPLPKQDKRPL